MIVGREVGERTGDFHKEEVMNRFSPVVLTTSPCTAGSVSISTTITKRRKSDSSPSVTMGMEDKVPHISGGEYFSFG